MHIIISKMLSLPLKFNRVGSRTNCDKPKVEKQSFNTLCIPSDLNVFASQSMPGRLKSQELYYAYQHHSVYEEFELERWLWTVQLLS